MVVLRRSGPMPASRRRREYAEPRTCTSWPPDQSGGPPFFPRELRKATDGYPEVCGLKPGRPGPRLVRASEPFLPSRWPEPSYGQCRGARAIRVHLGTGHMMAQANEMEGKVR